MVLSFGLSTKSVLSQIDNIYFSQLSWVFSYKKQGHKVADDLNQELKEFSKINLSSRWFVLVTDEFNQNVEFHELYRKSERSDLTVSQLCSSKMKLCPKPEYIWKRREDLSGVHLKIATPRHGDSLLQNNNGVSHINIYQNSSLIKLKFMHLAIINVDNQFW